MILKLIIKKILSCITLVTFAFGEASFAADASRACLAPPSYLKPPCSIVTGDDGTCLVKEQGPGRSGVEFLWFTIAEALDRGLSENELKSLTSELFKEDDKSGSLETFDVQHIVSDRGSFLLPIKGSSRAFRFFPEANSSEFSDEPISEERLLLSTGKIIRFSRADLAPSQEASRPDQEDKELSELKDIIRFFWQKHRGLWNNLHALNIILKEEFKLETIKVSGKKLLMYSKNKKYILKVSRQDDQRYFKEKEFFLRGLAIPRTKLLFHHDESGSLIFNNVTINNDSVLFYDYLRNHLSLEKPESAKRMMKAYAKVMADIHSGPIFAEGDKRKAIFKPQDWESQTKRIEERRQYLLSRGYDMTPPLELFLKAQSLIKEDDIVITHGDPSPWNCYVNVEEGKISSIIDAETSSEESRYKDMAKVIIALIDSSKNSPHMSGKLESMLTEFFEAYFKATGIDREKAFRALPYYLGTQLLWYTEETQRVFSVPVWVKWRLELCRWALERQRLDIKDLIAFLSQEKDKLVPSGVDALRICDERYEVWASSGGELSTNVGDKVNIHLEVTFPENLQRTISGLQLGVELWTDMDQEGAWYGIPSFELKEMYGNRAIFEGQITPRTPGYYRMTARVSINSGRPDIWASNPYGDIRLWVKDSGQARSSEPIWLKATNDTYNAVMMDYDGTVRDYDGTISEEMYDACADMIRRGVHVCINTSRSTHYSIIEFFTKIRQRLGNDFRPEYCHVYSGLGYYNLNKGIIEGYEVTPEIRSTLQKVMETMKKTWLNGYADNLHIDQNGALIGFIFKGNTRKDIFARVLNEFLGEMNPFLQESVVAVYSDNYFQIIPKKMAKHHWMEHFSKKTGIPVSKIVRIGDQGQRYGVDAAMCDSYGGFTVNHESKSYEYPLSTPKYLGVYGIAGTVWLLKNLHFSPYGEGKSAQAHKINGKEPAGPAPDRQAVVHGPYIDNQSTAGFTPEPGVWKLEASEFASEISGQIGSYVANAHPGNEAIPYQKANFNRFKPKGLILYADSIVKNMGFIDMGKTFSEGFFNQRKIFEDGSIVLYGAAENCRILSDIINSADPSIKIFVMESVSTPSENVELEVVADRARRIVRKASGIEYDFIGLIKGRADRALSLVRTAKDIEMPIIVYDNAERGVYSFRTALIEAFNRRYSGSMDRWVCYLAPVVKISAEAAENFRRYLLERERVATNA